MQKEIIAIDTLDIWHFYLWEQNVPALFDI